METMAITDQGVLAARQRVKAFCKPPLLLRPMDVEPLNQNAFSFAYFATVKIILKNCLTSTVYIKLSHNALNWTLLQEPF